MKNFLIKCFVVTACLILIMKCIPVPEYVFIDKETKGNRFTGKVHKKLYGGMWD